MTELPISLNEEERLAALLRYHVLDTPLEKQFDDIVKLASQICGTPIALISLVDKDRQWFKAKVGIDVPETPRDISACQYTIMQPGLMIVPDTHEDNRFKTNPLVTGDPHMRFYAGAPLATPLGYNIGTLCILDTKPRQLSEDQKTALEMLSSQVMALLELKLAQATAMEAVERIGLALDSGTILGTWVWDIAEDRITGDERFAHTFNLDARKMHAGMKLAEVVTSIHPDDVDDVNATIQTALQQGGRYQKQYRVRQPGNRWLWIEANGRVELDNTGKAIRFPGVLIDINKRKHMELAFAKTSLRYKILFESIDEGFCTLEMKFDNDGNAIDYIYREVNPAFEKHTGMKDVVNRSVKELLGSHEDYWLKSYGDVAKTGRPMRGINQVAALDKWFEVSAFRIGDDGHYQVAVIFTDITDKQRAETALRQSEAHLNLMVESAHEYAIISMDLAGIIQSWNSGAERIFGYKPNEAIGHPIDIIFTKEDCKAGVPDYERSVAAKNGKASDERWHERITGETFYASGIMTAMYNEEKELTGFIKIARDMTIQQRNQEALLEARNAAEAANIAKTEFLANMSHEIRTPMNAIIGLSNILSMSRPLTDKQQQFIKTLQMSADSLLALINDLLDISKIEARSVELEQIPFSMSRLVQEVISMMAVRVKEKGLTFTAEGECIQNQTYIGDPHRLRQVVLNLCSNAIKFTEQGGIHVALTCHPTQHPDIENICIMVKDTGIGIEHTKLEMIFDKFIQADTSINRKYGGTGLGLAITKTIAEIMGGTITVESEPGKGSTFTVYVPLRKATNAEIQQSNESLGSLANHTIERKAKPRILLAEDYQPNVLVATTVLEEFGYLIDVASNGNEAIEMVKKQQYVAVLMDVQMHGMNGLDATRAIRTYEEQNHLPRIPIIGMTAHALTGDRERCIGVGMDDYISKPFNTEELRRKLEEAIETV